MKRAIIYTFTVAMLFASLTACGRTAPQPEPAATSTPAPEPAATPTPEPLADTEPEPEEMSQAELTKLFRETYDSRLYSTFNTEQESINFELQYIEVEAEIAKKTLPPDYTEQYALWRAEQEEAQKPADSSEPVQREPVQQQPPQQQQQAKPVQSKPQQQKPKIEIEEDKFKGSSSGSEEIELTRKDVSTGVKDPFHSDLGVTLDYG